MESRADTLVALARIARVRAQQSNRHWRAALDTVAREFVAEWPDKLDRAFLLDRYERLWDQAPNPRRALGRKGA